MTSEYIFQKWRNNLKTLDNLINTDLDFQDSKALDVDWYDAVVRLSGILASYISCYCNAIICYKQNLQVQKSSDIAVIVKAVIVRIHELRGQLSQLEGDYYPYISGGLIEHKLTYDDVQFRDIIINNEREENIRQAIKEAFDKSNEKPEVFSVTDDLEKNNYEPGTQAMEVNWWDDTEESNKEQKKAGINITAIYKVEEKLSEETLKRKAFIALIGTHEKTRQITLANNLRKLKRIMWEKELRGTLKQPASLYLRDRSAKMIQMLFRTYFNKKRQRILNCKRAELLGLLSCSKTDSEEITHTNALMNYTENTSLFIKYKEEWESYNVSIKDNYLKRSGENVADDFRDFVREWFKQWYNEIKFFYDIPKENQGGLAKVIKDNIPSPSEWMEQYYAYIEEKKRKKNKTATEKKWDEMEAKREKLKLKSEEKRRKKAETDLVKKMMKNPKLHPGYHYPKSKKMLQLVEAIKQYKDKWLELDYLNTKDVKEKFVKSIVKENVHAETKTEICNKIGEVMREELNILKKALIKDYEMNEEVMPENFKQKNKHKKKKSKAKSNTIKVDDLKDKLVDLISKGFVIDYAKKGLENFLGDPHFAGDDLKSLYKSVQPMGWETRVVWWEKCQELSRGFKRILLVGANKSGKSTLVRVMASLNDAILYEIKLDNIEDSKEYLLELSSKLVFCARATQPSVIYFRHVHQLYHKKRSPDAHIQAETIKIFLIKKLIKKFRKTDNITLVGSCVNPWLTKNKSMLKHFQSVIMLPQTTYSSAHLILRHWVNRHRIVPCDLEIQTLARSLRDFSYGFILDNLELFLSPDRIVKIAANGLRSDEIHDYFTQIESQSNIDHEKYIKWFTDKTHWGKVEKKSTEERVEFRDAVIRSKQKSLKKKNTPAP